MLRMTANFKNEIVIKDTETGKEIIITLERLLDLKQAGIGITADKRFDVSRRERSDGLYRKKE